MKEILADSSLRQFAFKWSKAQYSSENIKFYVAVENLLKCDNETSKSIGLKKLRDEFIISSAPRFSVWSIFLLFFSLTSL